MKLIKFFFITLIICIFLSEESLTIPVDGTIANTFLTNICFVTADNVYKSSTTNMVNISTNAGGQFVSVSPDQYNGMPLTKYYFTNSLKNWGNATDIYILKVTATNTNTSGESYGNPWQYWFESPIGNKVTNIKIAPGKTNTFYMVIRPSFNAGRGSYVEFRLATKSSNSTKANTNIYLGDNNYTYGGPTNSGIGQGSDDGCFINIYSNSTPYVKNNEFIRVTILNYSNFYVNDNNTANDIYCTAVGNDINNGLSPAAPKRTITNLINTYKLKSKNVVYVDAGTYPEKVTITASDEGNTGGYVKFFGTGLFTSSNRTYLNSSTGTEWDDGAFYIDGADYIQIWGFSIRNSASHCYGIYVEHPNTNIIIANNHIFSNELAGIRINEGYSGIIRSNYCYYNDRNWGYGDGIIFSDNDFYSGSEHHTGNGCKYFYIYNNVCGPSNAGGLGMDYESKYNIISNNIFCSNRGSGIHLSRNSVSNSIISNKCNENGDYGIGLDADGYGGSSFNFVYGNICNENKKSGIYLAASATKNVEGNIIKYNICNANISNGIKLKGGGSETKNNKIIRNICNSNHLQGIDLELGWDESGVHNNIIFGGICFDNWQDGIRIKGCESNTVQNCTFISNNNVGFDLYWETIQNPGNIIKNIITSGNNNKGVHLKDGNTPVDYSLLEDGVNVESGNFTGEGTYTNQPAKFINPSAIPSGLRLKWNSLGIMGTQTNKKAKACMGYYDVGVKPSNPYINMVSAYTIGFVTAVSDENILGGSYFKIEFPTGFKIKNNSGVTSTSMNGTFAIDSLIAPNEVIISRSGGSLIKGGKSENIIISAVTNINTVSSNYYIYFTISSNSSSGIIKNRIASCNFRIITPPPILNIVKTISNISLNGGILAQAIPGATITYKVWYTNSGCGNGVYSIIQDKISAFTIYLTNSYGGNTTGWTVEWSTNTLPSQTYNSSDYTNVEPNDGSTVKWIRWEKTTLQAGETDTFYFKVMIK